MLIQNKTLNHHSPLNLNTFQRMWLLVGIKNVGEGGCQWWRVEREHWNTEESSIETFQWVWEVRKGFMERRAVSKT